MNKEKSEHKWASEPGFDTASGKYISLDLEKWIRRNKIREIGRSSGEKNLPHTSEVHNDEIPAKIVDWVNSRGLRCQSTVSQHLTSIASNLQILEDPVGLEKSVKECKETARNIQMKLDQKKKDGKSSLYRIAEDVRHSSDDLARFRSENNLKRLPDYSHRKNALLTIAACAVIEILLNASLLMDVVPTGLLGSFLQMALIVGVNILTGALAMGALLRALNFRSLVKQTSAGLGLLLVISIITTFNLAVGHYRDALLFDQASTESSISTPKLSTALSKVNQIEKGILERFRTDPLGLDHFQSMLLVIVGLMFFSISSWKGYQRDDAYPGYGQKFRQHKKMEDRYHNEYLRTMDTLDGIYHNDLNALIDKRYHIEAKKDNYKTQCIEGERIVNEYGQNLKQYKFHLKQLLTAYYTANRETRTTEAPVWPELELDSDIFEVPVFNPPPDTQLTEVYDKIHNLIMETQEYYDSARNELVPLNELNASATFSESSQV